MLYINLLGEKNTGLSGGDFSTPWINPFFRQAEPTTFWGNVHVLYIRELYAEATRATFCSR